MAVLDVHRDGPVSMVYAAAGRVEEKEPVAIRRLGSALQQTTRTNIIDRLLLPPHHKNGQGTALILQARRPAYRCAAISLPLKGHLRCLYIS